MLLSMKFPPLKRSKNLIIITHSMVRIKGMMSHEVLKRVTTLTIQWSASFWLTFAKKSTMYKTQKANHSSPPATIAASITSHFRIVRCSWDSVWTRGIERFFRDITTRSGARLMIVEAKVTNMSRTMFPSKSSGPTHSGTLGLALVP